MTNPEISAIASALGKRAAGKPKNFSPEELKLRAQRLAVGRDAYNAKRREAKAKGAS